MAPEFTSIVIKLEQNKRIRVHAEGGLDLERYVAGGIGWINDNADESVTDEMIQCVLTSAVQLLQQITGAISNGS